MGNSESNEEKADQEYNDYISSMQLVRKEHSDVFGKEIDLYKKSENKFDEELVLCIELPFDEEEGQSSQSQENLFKQFKEEINRRKQYNCKYISQLLFVNYKIFSGLCMQKVSCRLGLQYSEENLFKVINDSKVLRSSMAGNDTSLPEQVLHFLYTISQALEFLHRQGKVHGFIKPINILILNKQEVRPFYFLADVQLINNYQNSYQRMLHDKDYSAPLDQDALISLEQSNKNFQFNESHDIWALGITTLCFIFNEDYNTFYDWGKRRVRRDKIDNYVNILCNVKYEQQLTQIITEMLDQNNYSRTTAERIISMLSKKFK